MSIRKVLQYPDPRLRIKAAKVTDFGAYTQQMIDDMFDTHYALENCAALACTQLDFSEPQHITVIDFSEEKTEPLCLINTQITHKSTQRESDQEGCMSVGMGGIANIVEKVERSSEITVSAQDRKGSPLEFTATGFMARCIQHELDHLEGVLFIDHLSLLKRQKLESKLKKFNKKKK